MPTFEKGPPPSDSAFDGPEASPDVAGMHGLGADEPPADADDGPNPALSEEPREDILPPPSANDLLSALGHNADDVDGAPSEVDEILNGDGGVVHAAPQSGGDKPRRNSKTEKKTNAVLKVVVLGKGETLDTWSSKAVWEGPLPQTFTATRSGKGWTWDDDFGKSVRVQTNERGQGGSPVESWARSKPGADKIIVYAQPIDDVTIDADAEDNALAPGHAKHEEQAGDGSTSLEVPDGQGPETKDRGGDGNDAGDAGGQAAEDEVDETLQISDAEEEAIEDFEEELGLDPEDEDMENEDTTGVPGPVGGGTDVEGTTGDDTEVGGTGPGGEKARSDGDGAGSEGGGSGGTEQGSRDGKESGSPEGMFGGEGDAGSAGVPSGNSLGMGLLGVPEFLKGAVELILIFSQGDITGAAKSLFKKGAKKTASVVATRKALGKQARKAARKQTKKALKEIAKNPNTKKAWKKAKKEQRRAAERRMYWEYQRKYFSEVEKQSRATQKAANKALTKNPADKAAQDALAHAKRIEEAAKVKPVAGRMPQNHEFAGKQFPDADIPAAYRTSSGGKGVKFNDEGFPDFSPHAKTLPNGKKSVTIKLTGSRKADEAAANKAAKLKKTPADHTWHHVEDGKTMMLVPEDLHEAVKHTGGAAMHKHKTGMVKYGD